MARRGKLKFEWVPKSWTGGWHGVQISLVPSHPDFKINLKFFMGRAVDTNNAQGIKDVVPNCNLSDDNINI